MAKNWFQAYLVPQMEKSDGYIHVFMCSQASEWLEWWLFLRHMQTGSRNPPKPKPEVVITRRREDISTWSQQLRDSFLARPIHFHLRRHRPTMENTNRYIPEVETVLQTGSTNNLGTKTDIDEISVAIPVFLGPVCHWCICQPHPTLP